MTDDEQGEDPHIDWATARQGDIVDLDKLGYWTGCTDPDIECLSTPEGVMLVSQTCDLVRGNPDDLVFVAPIVECTKAEKSQIHKGRSPLRFFAGSRRNKVVDMNLMASVPRRALSQTRVVDRTLETQSGEEAGRLAARIGWSFSRYPFPDEVISALGKLRRKVSDSYRKETSFAGVLRRIDEFRVACNDWSSPDRQLTIFAIVPARHLPPPDMKPEWWQWSPDTVAGVKTGMQPQDLDLETLSNLILHNIAEDNDSALVELWFWWSEALAKGHLGYSDDADNSIELEIVSAQEFTYETYTESETLDFSALSLDHAPSESSGRA